MSMNKFFTYFATAFALTACQSQSQIESNFLSTSTPTPIKYADQTDNATNQFAGGSSTGVAFTTATDGLGSSNYLRLNQASDGAAASDLELSSSWTPAWSNLVGYWKLNGTLGSGIADGAVIPAAVGSSGTFHNSNSSGAPTTQYSTGQLNQGITFDGVDDRVTVPAIPSSPGLAFSAWIKPLSYGGSGCYFAGQEGDFRMGFDSGGNVYLIIKTLNNPWYSAGTVISDYNSLPVGSWYHIVGTYEGSRIKLYINGNFIADGGSAVSGNFSANTGDPFGIGIEDDGGSAYGGACNAVIDEVAIWNIGLSAKSIDTIYQHQLSHYAGTFTSRVMDGLSISANWTNFSWIPTLPFFKELPDAAASETQANYSSQSANLMNGIIGLWHLDETIGATTAADGSGNGNAGTLNNVASGANGIIGNAGNFNGTNSSVQFGTLSDYTATQLTGCAWINPSYDSSQTNPVIFSNYASASNEMQFYIQGNGTQNPQLRLYFNIGGNITTSISSISTLVLNTWSHVCFTVDSISNLSTLYINGISVGTGNYIAPTYNCYALGERGAGCNGGDNPFVGLIDEASLWSRSLSSSEILELYRRGANRIKYQLRTCADSTCSTNPVWQGPDNTNQTYFSELSNTLGNAASGAVQPSLPSMLFSNFMSLFIPSHQYFQYRAIMESDDTSTNCNYGAGPTWCSPELKSVTAGPIHQQ